MLSILHWIKYFLLDGVIFEMDCKPVVDSLTNECDDHSEFGAIISQCKVLFSTFYNSRIEFDRREFNVVVHKLVRVATSFASSHIFHYIPLCIAKHYFH